MSVEFQLVSIAVHGSEYVFLSGVGCGIGLALCVAWIYTHQEEVKTMITYATENLEKLLKRIGFRMKTA